MPAGRSVRLLSFPGAVLLAGLALAAGCQATVPWQRGDYDTTIAAGLDQTARAAQMTVAQLDCIPVIDLQDKEHATLIVHHPAGPRLEIYLEPATALTTRMKIRLSPPGPDPLTQDLFTRINANL